jgi:hypothetical protein
MNTETNQGRPRELKDKIVGLMKSIGHAPKKPLLGEEMQKLKTAASRLDQILKASAQTDREVLRSAAVRLDTLLCDLRDGKDVPARLKRRTKTNAKQG